MEKEEEARIFRTKGISLLHFCEGVIDYICTLSSYPNSYS